MMVQFADDINTVVFKHADAVRRIKQAIVKSFEEAVKKPRPKCCPDDGLKFTDDRRFPGMVRTETGLSCGLMYVKIPGD